MFAKQSEDDVGDQNINAGPAKEIKMQGTGLAESDDEGDGEYDVMIKEDTTIKQKTQTKQAGTKATTQ
jgi:hypothetical protein